MNLETLLQYDKFKELFDQYNQSLGNALVALREQPQDLVGREDELKMLRAILERPITPVALLLGQAGVGKTAIVEEFMKRSQNSSLSHDVVIALRVGQLASIGIQELQSQLALILPTLAEFEKLARSLTGDEKLHIVLFIDEVHMLVTIFGPGTKIGGDVLKDVLARSPLRVIAATTRAEYDSTIAVDKPLAERFKQIEISELQPDNVVAIAKNWWMKVAPDCTPISEQILRMIIDVNAQYRADSAEPRKTLDILEDCVSYCRIQHKPVTDDVVNMIFSQRYSVILKYHFDFEKIFEKMRARVKGQDFAMTAWHRLLRSLQYSLDENSNRPILTALLTGPTGVGKSETVKALAQAMYGESASLVNFNMPDFKTPESDEFFRRRLGQALRHAPNSIVLFDEYEKAHPSILDSMLAILDEGIVHFTVTNREGLNEPEFVSLRNSIIVGTTNAGASVFANDARFSQREIGASEEILQAELTQLYETLIPHLQRQGFKPEMLGRFDRIIPYRSLDMATLLELCEMLIEKTISSFSIKNGITIDIEEPKQWPQDIYDYYTTELALYIVAIKLNANDSNAGGARQLKSLIKQHIFEKLIDACITYPKCRHFKCGILKSTKIYNYYASATVGGVYVQPLD